MYKNINGKEVGRMPVWLKRLSFILSILVLLVAAGCGTSLEKPLSKEEISKLESVEKKASNTDEDIKLADEKEKEESKSDVLKKEIVTSENSEGNISSAKNTGKQEEGKSEPTSSKALNSNTVVEQKTSVTNRDNLTNQDSESKRVAKTEVANDVKNQYTKPKESTSTNSANKESTVKKQENTKNDTKLKEEQSSTESTKEKVVESKLDSSVSNSNPKPAPKPEPEAPKNSVIYSIVISSSEVPLAPTEIEINDGDTVLDALIKITRDKKIQMDYRGGQGATAYVEGIANVYEFDRGQGSGWMYRVNGIFPDRSAGIIPLYPGDRVEWLYTTDLGNDLGADLKPFRR